MSAFTLGATDGAARTGVLRTAHGELRTPAFMPVGTKATVKAVDPDELRALGAEILLCNTYHLHFRPGADLIAELGGLHRFMAWDGPILTDSGGFQVFSLRHTILAPGRRRRSRSARSTTATRRASRPSSRRASRRSSAPTSRCASTSCPPPDAPRSELERGGPPHDALGEAPARAPSARRASSSSGSPRAARDPELRRRSVEEIAELGFDGHALGGLAIGESTEQMLETTAWAAQLLPPERPRYFMGIGDPEGILEVIERGIDMFDCVLPTRNARTGSALTWEGQLNLKDARFARDPRPLDEGCACPACTRFSRAYVRHLAQPAGDPGAAAAEPA